MRAVQAWHDFVQHHLSNQGGAVGVYSLGWQDGEATVLIVSEPALRKELLATVEAYVRESINSGGVVRGA